MWPMPFCSPAGNSVITTIIRSFVFFFRSLSLSLTIIHLFTSFSPFRFWMNGLKICINFVCAEHNPLWPRFFVSICARNDAITNRWVGLEPNFWCKFWAKGVFEHVARLSLETQNDSDNYPIVAQRKHWLRQIALFRLVVQKTENKERMSESESEGRNTSSKME